MAITKLMHMKEASKGAKSSHLKNAIDYIFQEHKVAKEEGIKYASSQGCMLNNAYSEMLLTKKQYGKESGRQGYHFVISFAPDDNVTKEQLWKITQGFVNEYLSGYEAVYAIHDDADHLHSHIIFNSVNYRTGYKYHYKNRDWEKYIQPIVDRLCIENNAPVLMYHVDEYEYASGEKKEIYRYSNKINWTKEIKKDIDSCIETSRNWQDFCSKMKEKGYRFNFGKSVSIRKPGMQRARRLKESTVGYEYTPDAIIERINIQNGRPLSVKAPVTVNVKISPKDYFISSKKYKKYKEMSFMQKVLVRHMMRIKRVIPEYRAYPGSFLADRKAKELQRAVQEFRVIKQYNIQSPGELDKLYEKLTKDEKEIRNNNKIYDLRMKEMEELKEKNKGVNEDGVYKNLKINEFVADYDENKSKSEDILKDIRKQKNAVRRLIKKYQSSEELSKNKTRDKEQDREMNIINRGI